MTLRKEWLHHLFGKSRWELQLLLLMFNLQHSHTHGSWCFIVALDLYITLLLSCSSSKHLKVMQANLPNIMEKHDLQWEESIVLVLLWFLIQCFHTLFWFQAMLNNREDVPQLMLDTKHLFQVTFPFSPSPHALELIQVPSSFKLGFLTKV